MIPLTPARHAARVDRNHDRATAAVALLGLTAALGMVGVIGGIWTALFIFTWWQP